MLQSIKNLFYGAWDLSLTGFLPAATAALLCMSAHGQTEASFGFGEPKVIKLDWGTRALQVADLDGDGLTDMAITPNPPATKKATFCTERISYSMEEASSSSSTA